jgi:hypothetical protein
MLQSGGSFTVGNPSASAGRSATAFLCTVNEQAGESRLAFQSTGTAPSYFTGNVGIGSQSASSTLQVHGVLTVSAGSAAAPALTISGDPNTGIFQAPASANTLSVTTDGVERMRVKATGAVRFVPLSADPGTADAGDVYYNSSTNKLRVYDGSSWVDLN